MARAQITQEVIEQINELYLKIGTYSGVSKEMGGSPSPSTVKKYIIPGYVSRESIVEKRFDKEKIPSDIDFKPFAANLDDWGKLCVLTEEEEEEIEELQKELVL